MSKFPLLEQLRADRLIRENEARAPVVNILNQANQHINYLTEERNQLKQYNLNPIRDQINDIIATKFAHDLINEVQNKIAQNFNKPVTITIDPRDIDWYSPSSMQKQILQQAIKEVNFSVFSSTNFLCETVQYAEININRTFRYRIPE